MILRIFNFLKFSLTFVFLFISTAFAELYSWENFVGSDSPPTSLIHQHYDYAPSMMKDINGIYKLWWCGVRDDGTFGDGIFYSETIYPNNLNEWTTPQMVFKGGKNNSSFDSDLVCDPSVIRVKGVYYMFYSGNIYDNNLGRSRGTAIGVAHSFDGKSWTRLNNGNPIIVPSMYPTPPPSSPTLHYGAGQPSVVFLDNWYYMVYHDSTAPLDPETNISIGSYITRSRSPIFLGDYSSQVYAYVNGSASFYSYPSLPNNWVPAGIGGGMGNQTRNWLGLDMAFHLGLNNFIFAFHGVQKKSHLAFYNYGNLRNEIGLTDIPINNPIGVRSWFDGPGITRTPRGYLENQEVNLYKNNCKLPMKISKATVDDWRFNNPSSAKFFTEIANSGATVLINKSCGNISRKRIADYDGDKVSDPIIYRPWESRFYINSSSLGSQVELTSGGSSSYPIEGDFDGDGKSDLALVENNSSFLSWKIKLSSGGSWNESNWGLTFDQIAIGDYNGDSKDDIGVYRNGIWYIKYQNKTSSIQYWGVAGDIPVPADYDNDGKDDLAIWRPNSGNWWIRQSSGGDVVKQWGRSGDIPIPADLDSDGKDDLVIWRPYDGTWYIRSMQNNSIKSVQWGLSGDIPKIGDYNGDGVLDLSVWRPSNQTWYISVQSRGSFSGLIEEVQWGISGDRVPQ